MADISKPILVIGGGISGVTTAVEAAEAGAKVVLVESNPYLGGRVAQLHQYFPKLCPPTCGLEINFKRIKFNPDITFYTDAKVTSVSGSKGNFDVTITLNPRYVNDKCTACGECEKVCSTEVPNSFNYGLDKVKAISLPHEMAYPNRYWFDAKNASLDELKKCVSACKYNAINPDAQAETITVNAGAIVVATGWKPYDMANLDLLGAGQIPNVISNVQMERMAAENGPTKGKIVRPSDQKELESIAFVQCAGSRDENHMKQCSSICCLASLKQMTYVRAQYPEIPIYMFYIDVRANGRYEDFYQKVAANDPNITLVKGKVAGIKQDGPDLLLEAEDTLTGKKSSQKVNMAVLATGMQPAKNGLSIPGLDYDDMDFVISDPDTTGIIGVGCAKSPVEVVQCMRDATGAALKAIQSCK
jgi:heterodisulfide reductase subunit A-like polyferredoxin